MSGKENSWFGVTGDCRGLCCAREAMVMPKEMGWTHIKLEGDCLMIINALNDHTGECLRPFGVIISARRDLFDF